MKSHDHEECDNHTSIMRGVCFCPDEDTVYFNPRLWADGHTELRPASEMDYIAGDCIELLIARFFPQFDENWVEATDLDVQMPGMVMECEQHTGVGGYHYHTRMS
jgi:hypothetical protein